MTIQASIVGERVLVHDPANLAQIGLGTYLGTHFRPEFGSTMTTVRILLDSGVEIYGYQCRWPLERPTGAPEVPPFVATLGSGVRTYRPILQDDLEVSDLKISAGEQVEVQKILRKNIDHRVQVAAQIIHKGTELYLLVTEMGLPRYSNITAVRAPALVN